MRGNLTSHGIDKDTRGIILVGVFVIENQFELRFEP